MLDTNGDTPTARLLTADDEDYDGDIGLLDAEAPSEIEMLEAPTFRRTKGSGGSSGRGSSGYASSGYSTRGRGTSRVTGVSNGYRYRGHHSNHHGGSSRSQACSCTVVLSKGTVPVGTITDFSENQRLTAMNMWLKSFSGVSSLQLSGDQTCRLKVKTQEPDTVYSTSQAVVEQSYHYSVGTHDEPLVTGNDNIVEVMMFCAGTGTNYGYSERGSHANNCDRCYVPEYERCGAHCLVGECYYQSGTYVRCNSCRFQTCLHRSVLALMIATLF